MNKGMTVREGDLFSVAQTKVDKLEIQLNMSGSTTAWVQIQPLLLMLSSADTKNLLTFMIQILLLDKALEQAFSTFFDPRHLIHNGDASLFTFLYFYKAIDWKAQHHLLNMEKCRAADFFFFLHNCFRKALHTFLKLQYYSPSMQVGFPCPSVNQQRMKQLTDIPKVTKCFF